MPKINVYQCPICLFFHQKFRARSKMELETHLSYSHLQGDLVRHIVKEAVRERV